MAKNWHNKHISTSWGIAIIGFLLVSVALLIPLLAQTQTLKSHAATGCYYNRLGILNPEGCFCSDKTGCRDGAYDLSCQGSYCKKVQCAVKTTTGTKYGYCQTSGTRCLGVRGTSGACASGYICCAK